MWRSDTKVHQGVQLVPGSMLQTCNILCCCKNQNQVAPCYIRLTSMHAACIFYGRFVAIRLTSMYAANGLFVTLVEPQQGCLHSALR
jgi:hypothetical protein